MKANFTALPLVWAVLLTCCTEVVGAQQRGDRQGQQESRIQFSAQTTKPIVVGGTPTGPQTMVLQSTAASLQWSAAAIGASSEGKPLSSTLAIVEPVLGSDDVIMLTLDKGLLKGSPYESRRMLLEFDARDMSPLLGQGAVYLLKPGIEKVRLGNYIVSTTEANDWCSVEITGPLSDPKIEGSGIKVSPVSAPKIQGRGL